MADERNPTSLTDNTTTTRTGTLDADRHDANRDPLSGEAGAHPVGTGVGAATGGTIGAVIGGAVGGPVGAMIGAAVGGMTGGFAGKGLAESVNPTEEDSFWSDAYKDRPYAQGRSYEDLRPAYRYGWESRTRHADSSWNDVESNLQSEWTERHGSTSNLDWNTAKPAAYDAWNRVESRHRFNTQEEPYWRETYQSRPYGKGRSYEELSPAYQYGWDSAHRYQGRQWNDVENDLRSNWERSGSSTGTGTGSSTGMGTGSSTGMGTSSSASMSIGGGTSGTSGTSMRGKWEDVKDAVRDSWDRASSSTSGSSGSVLNRDMTGTYDASGTTGGYSGTTGGTGTYSSGTTGGSYTGTGSTGTGGTVPTGNDMVGGATEGTHNVNDPNRDRNRKI